MSVRVEHGDSRDVLKTLADCSVDAVVTDPPYALVSIQKRFGKPGSAEAKDRDGLYKRASAGFMGQKWDTGEVAFDPAFWAEVLRVLKPGGHLLAFSGTRTYHRLACAIEDAGFEIRDQIGWCYASGFAKSHNVSKAIDRAAGAERPVIGTRLVTDIRRGILRSNGAKMEYAYTSPATAAAAAWEGWNTALKPAWEPICLARKPLIGTVAENVLRYGTGALNIDGCRIASEVTTGWGGAAAGGNTWNDSNSGLTKPGDALPVKGRWPANIIHDGSEEVIAAFPHTTSGTFSGKRNQPKTKNTFGTFEIRDEKGHVGDSGSAARFFYSAKADAADRLGSKHPTVKPVDLMAYLCRLVTPPGGTVLDPFAGSGTTGMACMREGFNAILIEREAQFVADIKRRIAHVSGQDAPLFAEVAQ